MSCGSVGVLEVGKCDSCASGYGKDVEVALIHRNLPKIRVRGKYRK